MKVIERIKIEVRNEHNFKMALQLLYIIKEKKYVLYIKSPDCDTDECEEKILYKGDVKDITLKVIKEEPWLDWWHWNWWRK